MMYIPGALRLHKTCSIEHVEQLAHLSLHFTAITQGCPEISRWHSNNLQQCRHYQYYLSCDTLSGCVYEREGKCHLCHIYRHYARLHCTCGCAACAHKRCHGWRGGRSTAQNHNNWHLRITFLSLCREGEEECIKRVKEVGSGRS